MRDRQMRHLWRDTESGERERERGIYIERERQGERFREGDRDEAFMERYREWGERERDIYIERERGAERQTDEAFMERYREGEKTGEREREMGSRETDR